MQARDSRERTDELYVSESHAPLPPDEFADAAESEAVTAGWMTTAFAFDDGRILLIEQP